MGRRLIAALVLAIALAAPAGAEEQPTDIRIHGGFISGREFMDMDGLQKKYYVAGLIEGMMLAPAFGTPEENMEWFHACTLEINLKEMRRYLFNYILERDDLWPNRNPAKMYRAIRELCQAHFKTLQEPAE